MGPEFVVDCSSCQSVRKHSSRLVISSCLISVWRYGSNRVMTAWFFRVLHHTLARTHTPHSISLSEWLACRRGRYLHNTQQAQETNIHTLSGIRTGNRSTRTAADLRLGPVTRIGILTDIQIQVLYQISRWKSMVLMIQRRRSQLKSIRKFWSSEILNYCFSYLDNWKVIGLVPAWVKSSCPALQVHGHKQCVFLLSYPW
jgi:hypothetical protein